MHLDVRIPIGLMFTLFGLLLAGFGLLSDNAIYSRSLGHNINLSWGVAMLVFGAAMLFFGLRGRSKVG
jgi:multisubunit Na+/H+ antiporter MnhG subunit